MSNPAQGAEGAETMTAVDWDRLNDLFSRMPSGPWDASRDTDGHEIRQIDADPTNKHHWPFRLCRSIPGQRAACDDAVFDFLAGVLNAWPQIAAERSEEAEIERILAMPEDELRKRCLVDGQSPEQTVQIADLAFECASLCAALIQIGQQYVTHRGDMTDGDALEAIRRLVDRALLSRKEVSGQSASLSPLQGQTANAEATGVEPGAAALASPRADSDERVAGETPWGIEEADGWIWVGPLARDGAKVNDFVFEMDIRDIEPEAQERSRADARRVVNAINATPAQPAGAVPDSLRALSEAASQGEWSIWREPILSGEEAVRELTLQVEQTSPLASHLYLLNANGKCPATTGCGPTSQANANFIVAAVNFVRTLLATHPAGQSAGSGAEKPWGIEEDGGFLWVGPLRADSTVDLVFEMDIRDIGPSAQERARANARRIVAAVNAAPDSTRTGQGEATATVPVEPTEEMWRAFGTLTPEAFRQKWAAALAARPAAPEAQGGWSFDMEAAPRDGTPLDLWCHERRHIDYRWDPEGRAGGWWSDTRHKDRHWRDREFLMPGSVTAWRLSDAPASSGQGGR